MKESLNPPARWLVTGADASIENRRTGGFFVLGIRQDQRREVRMNIKKRKAKIREMTEFSAEAHKRAAEYAQAQLHFLRVAIEIGRDLEPAGPMAGFRG